MIKLLMNKLRASLLRGAVFIAPIWLSVFLVGVGYNLIEQGLGDFSAQCVRWLVPAQWLPSRFADGHIPGLSLLVAFVVLAAVGSIASWQIGRRGLKLFDRLFLSLPILRSVYSAVRKLIDSVAEGQARFQKVVFIEWPNEGVKTFGFVTQEIESEVSEDSSDSNQAPSEKHYVVFVPMMPNPTSGFVLVLPASKVTETSMTPEEALKFGMSLGVLAPASVRLDRL